MLDFADVVAINKFERRGSDDARRDVARQLVRNREAFGSTWEDMPVFGTSAASFDDDGVTALYLYLRDALADKGLPIAEGELAQLPPRCRLASGRRSLPSGAVSRGDRRDDSWLSPADREARRPCATAACTVRPSRRSEASKTLHWRRWPQSATRPKLRSTLLLARLSTLVRGRLVLRGRTNKSCWSETGNFAPRCVARPSRETRSTSGGAKFDEVGSLLRYLRRENLPGYFPYTAGFPVQARWRGSARMFAGEATPSVRTAASTLFGRSACNPPLDRVRLGDASTGVTPACDLTSTARSARQASRSQPSTT